MRRTCWCASRASSAPRSRTTARRSRPRTWSTPPSPRSSSSPIRRLPRGPAAPTRSTAHRRWPTARAVPAPPRLAHRPELSPPAARHLAVPRGAAGAARPGPDIVRRRHRRLRGTAAGAEGARRYARGPACRPQRRPRPRQGAGRRDAPPARAARAAAAPAGRTRPSGDRQARAVSMRVWPDGLAGGSVRRHAARAHGDGAALWPN